MSFLERGSYKSMARKDEAKNDNYFRTIESSGLMPKAMMATVLQHMVATTTHRAISLRGLLIVVAALR